MPPRNSPEYAVMGLDEKLGAVAIQQFPANVLKRKTTNLYDLFNSREVLKGGWDKSGVPRDKLLDTFADYLPELSYHSPYINVLCNAIAAHEYVKEHGSREQKERVEGVGKSLRDTFRSTIRGLGHGDVSEKYTKMAYERMAKKPPSERAAYMMKSIDDVAEYNGITERHVMIKGYNGEDELAERGTMEWRFKPLEQRLSHCHLMKHPFSNFRAEHTDLYKLMTSWDVAENGWENCGVPKKDLTRELGEYIGEAGNVDYDERYPKAVLRNFVSARKYVEENGTRVQKAKLKRDAEALDDGVAFSLGGLFEDKGMLKRGWQSLKLPIDVLTKGLTRYLTSGTKLEYSHTSLSNAFSAWDTVMKKGTADQKKTMKWVGRELLEHHDKAIMKMGYSEKMAKDVTGALKYVGWSKDIDDRGRYMKANLDKMAELAKAHGPEVGEELHRYNNICLFSKFTVSQMKTAYDNRDRQDVPYVMAVSVRDDHNGCYSGTHEKNPWGVLDKQLPEGTIVRMVEVTSATEALRAVNRMDKKYGTPMLSMLNLHASKNGIAFSCYDGDRVSTDDLESVGDPSSPMSRLMPILKRVMPPKSIFVLQGCEAGAKDAIGQRISKELDVTVVAAQESCYFDDLTLHKRGQQLIPMLETATWDNKKGRERQVKTRIFSGGTEVSKRRYRDSMDFSYQHEILRQMDERRAGRNIGDLQQVA